MGCLERPSDALQKKATNHGAKRPTIGPLERLSSITRGPIMQVSLPLH